MNKQIKLLSLAIGLLLFQSIYAQFPYDSGAFFTPERAVIYYNRDEFSIFPNHSLETYGCMSFNQNPSELIVRDLNGNPFVSFSGGLRIGYPGHRACFESGRSNYATTKNVLDVYPTLLPDTITITFPNPVKFSDVFVSGKPNQQIRVTLNGSLSTTYNLTNGQPYKQFAWHHFPGQTSPPTVSTITIKSLSNNWNFEISNVTYFRPPVVGGGGGNGGKPPPPPETPVVFVPGIAGSVLRLNPGTPNSEIRWIPPTYSALLGLSVLALDSNGESINNIDVPRVARNEPLPKGPNNTTYKELLNDTFISNNGYIEYDIFENPYHRTLAGCISSQTPRPTLFVFAYDWRKSNTQNTAALREYIECVRLIYHDVNPNQQVNIVSHSMGGLLSRRYILDYPNDNHVKKFISVNSPYLGAPRGIHVMETGSFIDGAFSSQVDNEAEIGSFVTARAMRGLANYFRGAHELLPSFNYFRLSPMNPFFIDGQPQNYGQTRDWLNLQHPVSLPAFTMASFHDYVNSAGNKQEDWSGDTTGIQYYHIYSKQRTNRSVGSVRKESYALCRIDEIDCIGSQTPPYSIGTRYRPIPTEGDGTVALTSASRIGNGFDLNYRQNTIENPFRFVMKPNITEPDTAADHNDSLKNPRVLKQIVNILRNDNNNVLEIDTSSNALKQPTEAQMASYFVTLTNIEQLSFGSNSPAPETIANSRFVATSGLSSNSESLAIPIGEKSAWVAVPAYSGEIISFKNNGTPMEIEVVKGVDYETATQQVRYSNLVLPANVLIELKVTPNGIENVRYDSNGDGFPETQINPTVSVVGALAKDITQPVLNYSFVQQSSQQLLTLTANDTESGVRQIRYSTDGQHFYPYTNPVLINPAQFQRVYAFAEDNNRNKTGISTINVPLSPSASEVSVSGRVLNQQNRGISRAVITITSTNGTFSKSARSNPFGYFSFSEIPSGSEYVISISHKRFAFNSQVLNVVDNVGDLIFTAN
jgi:pimeloyl-ACP methyl ester carboxylesterase